MNIAARIVKRFLKPLSHPFLMLTRWSARSVKARMLRSSSPPLQAVCPAVQVVPRQEHFPAVLLNQVFPELDFLGAGLAPFI